MDANTGDNPFLRDVGALRAAARKNLDKGAVTPNYQGDADAAIALLQTALATEIVCVLRYTMNSISVAGINSQSVAAEFMAHANEERGHMLALAERIDQLGGTPDFDPDGLATRSATEYGHSGTLIEMVRENLFAERVAIEHYRDLIRYFGERDPTTRRLLESLLADEEEHAADMHDLLAAHEGKPIVTE